MKKSDLLAVFGTLRAIGEVFAPFNDNKPLVRATVSMWDDVPELREYQLRELMPDIDARIRAAKKKARVAA